jgi:hypothetical protein
LSLTQRLGMRGYFSKVSILAHSYGPRSSKVMVLIEKIMRSTVRLSLIAVCLCTLFSCYGSVPPERVLFDFESDAELDRLHWKCPVLLSLSDEHVTHGNRSLKLDLYPSNYPGLHPMLEDNNWRGYKALCFDIYNPEERELSVSVRIDDRKDYPKYADRYNKRFVLTPGMNHMRIPLETLVTSGTNRKLDLGKIYRLLIFMVHPEKRVALYVDYLRLGR